MRQYDAVILAGGRCEWLREACATEFRCLAPLGGRRMVDYIIDALQQSGCSGRIILAAAPEALPLLQGTLPEGVELCAAAGNLAATAAAAASLLDSGGNPKFLGVCDDIPLLTAAGVRSFLARCEALPPASIYYPIIPREACLQQFPEARRTFAALRDGVFTGGNMMLLDKEIVPPGQRLAEELFALRKSPLRLARWLGWSFILKALFRRLSTAEAEERFFSITRMRGRAVISEHAGIGMDVDKPDDLHLAEKYLNRQIMMDRRKSTQWEKPKESSG